jgi:GT2 family glycosyltransferase
MSRVAVVAIGRNEGHRLARCLESLAGQGAPVIYVDSGSTDGSPQLARRLGAEVLALDPARPFTAGRGRNEGFERAMRLQPAPELVQFVDGDCEVAAGWLERAARELDAAPELAAVAGRVREIDPDRSIYNRLCDLGWQQDLPGQVDYVGGNAMLRARAFAAAGGFSADLIAGEEPELCLRLRRAGGRIRLLDQDMVFHDAAMLQFGQWWRRTQRTGWAYAEGATLHGRGPERHWVRKAVSVAFWGLAVPLAALLPAWPTRGASLLLLLGYPVLGWRVWRSARRRGTPPDQARLLAAFTVLGKLAQAAGQVQFAATRLRRRRGRVVDWRSGA